MTFSKQRVKNLFSERAVEWAASYAKAEKRTLAVQNLFSRQRFALQMVELAIAPSSKILDAGCGSGEMAAKLMERGYEVWGIDLAEPMIRHARALCRSNQFQVGDIEQIPFPDNTFDAVVSLGVIEYLDGDQKALGEIWRVLKPGGTAVIATPSAISPLQSIDRTLFRLMSFARPAYYFVKYRLRGKAAPSNEAIEVFHRRYYRKRWLRLLASLRLEPNAWLCHGWGWFKSPLGHVAGFLSDTLNLLQRVTERLFGPGFLSRSTDRFVRSRTFNWLASEQIVRVRAIKGTNPRPDRQRADRSQDRENKEIAMRVSIFGLGYVGCVTAACLAKAGHDVIGVDVSAEKVAMINAGTSPVIEPGLHELVASMVDRGRLRATTSVDEAVSESDLAMICVGTPSGRNGELDVTAIQRVGKDIGGALHERKGRYVVVLRSTVLPGTVGDVLIPAVRKSLRKRFAESVAIAVNPEFMREGSSLSDFEHPPMTLVGCAEDDTAGVLRHLYQEVDAPFVQTSISVAEMTKYVSNAFHALKICFANEIGDLCESLGVNAQEVTRTFLMDRKLNVSEAYLRPGFAFGGSCLPKDLRALLYAARKSDVSLPLLTAIGPSNEHQIRRGIDTILSARKKRIGVVGLAFKSGTDDLRESPMVTLVETLIGKGCAVRIFDPKVRLSALIGANRHYIEREIPHIASLMCDEIESLISDAEVIVIGSPGEDAARALAQCRPDQIVVDLTRGAMRPAVSREDSEEPALAWQAIQPVTT
jgi:GDP-mannose 6-dehydrogenase